MTPLLAAIAASSSTMVLVLAYSIIRSNRRHESATRDIQGVIAAYQDGRGSPMPTDRERMIYNAISQLLSDDVFRADRRGVAAWLQLVDQQHEEAVRLLTLPVLPPYKPRRSRTAAVTKAPEQGGES